MREYRKLCRELSNLFFNGSGGGNRRRSFYDSRSALSGQQQCIVKCRKGKSITAHQRFIKEYLPQENKSLVTEKPELFSAETVNRDYLDQYAQAMAGRHFKFIISPESTRVDIPAIVKTLDKRVEKITGYSFYWMAAVHTDMDHPHAHFLLNSKDKYGQGVRFDKLFITQNMWEMSRQLCIELIGKRSGEEIQASLSQSHKSDRYCHIDESIHLYETAVKQKDEIYETRVKVKKLFYLERGWQKNSKP